jgi:hypothetical protein
VTIKGLLLKVNKPLPGVPFILFVLSGIYFKKAAGLPAAGHKKQIQKSLKKWLTNKVQYDILNKLSRGHELSKTPKRGGYRTLKIKQYRKSLKDL